MILDTCALIWLSMGGENISKSTLQAIDSAATVYVSPVSAFEIAHKYASGGLVLPCDPEKWFLEVMDHHDLTELPLDIGIAIASTKLPRIHKDPCDRFIIAAARLNHLRVVTSDARFREYGIETIW